MSKKTTVWMLKRNCSAAPAQLALVLATLAALGFAIGAGFAWAGLWLVLPFIGVELIAVAVAFLVCGRHAADYERIELGRSEVLVRRVESTRVSEWRLPRFGLRVELEAHGEGELRSAELRLAACGETVDVGRHLPPRKREHLAQELRRALRGAAVSG